MRYSTARAELPNAARSASVACSLVNPMPVICSTCSGVPIDGAASAEGVAVVSIGAGVSPLGVEAAAGASAAAAGAGAGAGVVTGVAAAAEAAAAALGSSFGAAAFLAAGLAITTTNSDSLILSVETTAPSPRILPA